MLSPASHVVPTASFAAPGVVVDAGAYQKGAPALPARPAVTRGTGDCSGSWARGGAALGLGACARLAARHSSGRAHRRAARGEVGDRRSLNDDKDLPGKGADDELQLDLLETELRKLVGEEDYAEAARVRDEISRASLEDEAAVLCAHAQFYKAFNSREIERMSDVWLQAPYVKCIHPYESRCTGHQEVCEMWSRVFKGRSRGLVDAEEVQVHVRGSTGTVTCREVYLKNGKKVPQAVSFFATNMFRKVAGQWLMLHRHVSSAVDENEDGDSSGDVSPMALQNKWAVFDAMTQMGSFEIYDEVEEESEDEDDDERRVLDSRDAVHALRKMGEQGQLSATHRIRLINHMLARNGDSRVEKAYNLLLRDVPLDERRIAWEEFTAIVRLEARRLDAISRAKKSSRHKSDD